MLFTVNSKETIKNQSSLNLNSNHLNCNYVLIEKNIFILVKRIYF